MTTFSVKTNLLTRQYEQCLVFAAIWPHHVFSTYS